ncbi:DNA helicase B isoform X2 [Anolis carolinensis]|uniref:DNA helicase B n=1 Tax=Anolis carolinensis TaxID=28377 RepID=H9G7R3_ANOCA|nr:PREDICTED: DNA helicase B [Anolis carolinensis]|eukprot:XP_008114794.1 PREDICTED: DNA helicase B [Anolis carolinensis]
MAQADSSGRSRPAFELQGLLLPLKDGVKDEDDEEEDDAHDAEPFDVASEENSQLLRPPRRRVKIQDKNTKKEYEVVGRFVFVGPWWKVNVKVKQFGSKYYMDGYPSYFLQTDAGRNQKAVISLFFNECGVPESLQKAFWEWLPRDSSLNIIHLEQTLYQFTTSKLMEEQISTDPKEFDIFYYVERSPVGKAVLSALAYPIVLEFLPKLLPCNVSDCIQWYRHSQKHCEGDQLTTLEKILQEEPWKLGFSKIMYREVRAGLAEACFKAFHDCEHLYQKIPTLQRNALMLYGNLKERCRECGHTYEEQDKLTDMVSKKMPVEEAWQALKFLKDEEVVITEKKLVFIPRLYKAEKQIADIVYNLRQNPPWHFHVDIKEVLNGGSCINNLRDSDDESVVIEEKPCERDPNKSGNASREQENCKNDFESEEQTQSKESKCEAEVDPDQGKAIELICSNPVTVISGKGGCGKTTVVSYLFSFLMKKENEEVTNACKDFETDVDAPEEWQTSHQSSNVKTNDSLNILFTAPTGKAAALLSKKTKIPAYTLHQVMYSYYAWRDNGGNSPWKFSRVNILVVDEGSLVPVGILSNVLKYLFNNAQLTKLIILGDIRQLPSIEPGNTLADFFASLKARGWCIELRTNHRSESQLIVENATRISQQKYPVFDQVLKFSQSNKSWPVPSPEKKFILLVLPAEDGSNYLQSAIMTLLENGPGLSNHTQSQFITFRRKDCDIINEICCKHYSKHTMRDHRNRLQFICGDKICSTRNEYVKALLARDNIVCTKNEGSSQCTCNVCSRREERNSGHTPSSQDDDTRLCNGEIFFITEDKEVDRVRMVTISITDGPEYTVVYKRLLKNSRIKHGWAKTIHTFQGSEENTIVYVVGNAGRQNWQHVYTAVTRGRCRVYIVAEEANLRAAIARENFRRKTRLPQRLNDALTEKISSSQQISSSQECSQNQEASTCFVDQEESVVSDKMETDSGFKVLVDTVDAAEQIPGERKRQSEFPQDCSSPSKVALIMEENKTSPLATNLLQSLTLKSPTPKKLFTS